MSKKKKVKVFEKNVNLIIICIFSISIVVALLFLVRSFGNNDDTLSEDGKKILAKNENITYLYGEYDYEDSNIISDKVTMTLEENGKFSILYYKDSLIGYVGTYKKEDDKLVLYTEYIVSDFVRPEYRTLYLTKVNNDEYTFNGFNGELNLNIKKTTKNEANKDYFVRYRDIIKEKKLYLYSNDDDMTINQGIYTLNNVNTIFKYIDRLNNSNVGTYVTSEDNTNIYDASTIYTGEDITKYNITDNQKLYIGFSNVKEENYYKDVLSSVIQGFFGKWFDINNYNNIVIGNKLYNFNETNYALVGSDNKVSNTNLVKRIYDYKIEGNNLYVYELITSYKCDNKICRYMPYTSKYSVGNESNTYDFTTKSVEEFDILDHKDKVENFMWTFTKDYNGNYTFESLQLLNKNI